MNEVFEVDRQTALLEVMVRAEALRRSELWTTALIHASILAVAFLAVVVVTGAASRMWPSLPALEGFELDAARLGLVILAGWIFASAWRRTAMTRDIEYRFLKDEVTEIQKRMTHS